MERSTPKPEAAARLLELIQMRLISGAIHVVAVLELPICSLTVPRPAASWPTQPAPAWSLFGA